MKEYNHKDVEAKWQKKWEEEEVYKVQDDISGKENKYILVEFPYPSGNAHIGHWYAFSVPDMYARYQRMLGYNVMYPFGFDSFGLPAENAAIKRNLDPKEWTNSNVADMSRQFKTMGSMIDWSRTVVASDPEYYHWTQSLFTKFFEKDIAYRATDIVNWCPQDQTVLANEQVVDGKCERCDTEVVQREQASWFMRITDYADRLVDDLDELEWPNDIKQTQKNWIGRKEGVTVSHKVVDTDITIDTFSAYPGWLFADTYLVLAPEHPLVDELVTGTKYEGDVRNFVAEIVKETSLQREIAKEKKGIFTGRYAEDPFRPGEKMPVWIANFAMMGFGTGAIRCSAHDERDVEFAKKYDISLRQVVGDGTDFISAHDNAGTLIDSGPFTGREISTELIAEMVDWMAKEGIAKKKISYRLRDWSLSRQRYWGCPIPIVYDPEGKAHSVPDEHLPWTLPTDVDFKPTGKAPLASSKELHERTESIFGKGWTPEVDTFDTFVDSSWYFYRYADVTNKNEFASMDKLKKWIPVSHYSGGAEHTTVHLLYARFWHKALEDMGLVEGKEPFIKRTNHGIILGSDGRKMSKRWGNILDPDEKVGQVGADTVRMYLAFIGPYTVAVDYPWDPGGVAGVRRFLERVWRLREVLSEAEVTELDCSLHRTIKKVGEDTQKFKFNTAIAQMMTFVNEAEKAKSVGRNQYEALLKVLAPFAPHITEEIWHELGHTTSIHLEEWPQYDEAKLETGTVTIAVQVNGKVRANIEISPAATEEEVRELVLGDESLKKWITAEPKKVVYVPRRLISYVL